MREQANMPLAIEPLHPAYAADRACVNTTKQALDICDRLDPQRTGALGVALDVYHIWWDPELLPQIARAGKDRLLAFHVCDWLVPTKDILNDRGMMGDGVIDIKSRAIARSRRRALPAIPRSRSFPTTGGASRWTRSCRPASSGTGRWSSRLQAKPRARCANDGRCCLVTEPRARWFSK